MSKPPLNLDQLLRRPDVWRGHSHSFVSADVLDTGYSELNQALHHQGWPTSNLIEVCQHYHACEWWLFHPPIKALLQVRHSRHLALLNPPAVPFISGLEQRGIPSQQVLVVQPQTPQEFVTCFCELSQSSACPVVLAWQPKRELNYTQLRKLQLSTHEQAGLYILFRHENAKAQSSPASVRLHITPKAQAIDIQIFKQKGKLQHHQLSLPIPETWKQYPAHNNLLQSDPTNVHRPAGGAQVALFPKISSRPLRKGLKRDYY